MESATVPGGTTGEEQAPPQGPPGEGFRRATAEAATQARALPPLPANEPVLDYAPGSPERDDVKAELARQAGQEVEIPLIIGGEEVRTGDTVEVVMPHDHDHVLARCHRAGAEEARAALEHQEALAQGILRSVDAHIAVLDASGTIIETISVDAPNEGVARERIYANLGSQHALRRTEIELGEVTAA